MKETLGTRYKDKALWRGFPVILTVMLVFAAFPAGADPENVYTKEDWELAGPPRCSSMNCTARYLSPVVRIAVTELLMLSGLALIYPEDLDLTDAPANTDQFVRSWTSPPNLDTEANLFESDGDPWAFNVFAHGLFGSETYLAARSWGHSPPVAVLFSIISSMVWEYLIESWSQQPSMIDMFWTPLGGSILGEIRYQAYMAAKRGIPYKGLRIALMIILDPIGEIERLVMRCQR